MKKIYFSLVLCLLLYSCDLFNRNSSNEEPSYNARIAWDSGLYSSFYGSTLLDGDFVYFYNNNAIVKLNVATGGFIWRSSKFYNYMYCPPILLDSYLYIFIEPNIINCFKKDTGELTATVQVSIADRNSVVLWNPIGHEQHLYFGYRETNRCFVQLDVNVIDHHTPDVIQTVVPEILWIPETGKGVTAMPVVYNNVVYFCTYDPLLTEKIELIGININTKEKVFYQTFGGIEDVNTGNIPLPERGGYIGANPIFIHDGILYYLSRSIAAWDLKTGKRLYRHVFTDDIPNEKTYNAAAIMQAVYYKNKIYYTTLHSYTSLGYRNIYCIDAANGKLVWSDIAKNSSSLETIPIIAHDRLYVSQSVGLRVYNPETGKLIGVDKSFEGGDMDRTALYGDLMICERYIDGGYRKVAVYVGK